MKTWKWVLVYLAAALPVAAASPIPNQEQRIAPASDDREDLLSTVDQREHMRKVIELRRRAAELPYEIFSQDVSPRPPMTLSAAGVPSVAAAGGKKSASPQTAGDIYTFSNHNGGLTLRASVTNPAATNTDFITVRYTTSQLSKQIRDMGNAASVPWQVDAFWMMLDDAYSWSKNWRITVVSENPARPFWPNTASIVSGPVTFDASTYYPVKQPQATKVVNAKVDLPDANYPAANMLAIDDLASDDLFDRPTTPSALEATQDVNGGQLWYECTGTDCDLAGAAPSILSVTGSAVRTTAAGTALGWRRPDLYTGVCNPSPTATTTCRRYLHDYIDNYFRDIVAVDQDVRLTVGYDLTSGQRAGVFFRGQVDFSLAAPGADNYYAVYLDKSNNTIYLTGTDSTQTATTLKSVVLGAPLPNTGTLSVEVTGWNPVVIDAKVNNVTVPGFRVVDTTRLYHGDPGWGNVYGIIFPNAQAGAGITDFKMERNADLFVIMKYPVGESATIWMDANEESREFSNAMFSTDGVGWTRIGGTADANCTRVWNVMGGLQVKDPSPSGNLYQVNNTLTNVQLPSCTVSAKTPFVCSADRFIDACYSDPNWQANWLSNKPAYEPLQSVDVTPRFTNEHSPDTPQGTGSRGTVLLAWVVCPDVAGVPSAACACNATVGDPGYNCDGYNFAHGTTAQWPNAIPGLTSTASTDIINPDGFPDGPLTFLEPGAPEKWIPQLAGNYHLFMYELGYDFATPDGLDTPNPDEYPINSFVSRPLVVTGSCVPTLPWNLSKNSLKLQKTDTANPCAAGQHRATWSLTTPVANNEPFNLHQILTAANKATITNPYPAGSVLLNVVAQTDTCFTAAPVASDVNYYSVFQADECNSTSRADQ